jgi:hypothetical protein
MNSEKYIGLDVHQATICVAVMDPKGKVIMESILETKAHAQHKGAPRRVFQQSQAITLIEKWPTNR